MPFTRNQIIGLIILLAGTIFFIVMGTFQASISTKITEDLKILTGKVEEIGLIEIETGRFGATHTSLYIKIKGTNIPFGITHNDDEDYQKYLHEIKVDDEIKIRYDSSEFFSGDNLKFGVYQIEKGGKILLHIDDVRQKNTTITIMLYASAAFMALLTTYIYYSIKKKNEQAAR